MTKATKKTAAKDKKVMRLKGKSVKTGSIETPEIHDSNRRHFRKNLILENSNRGSFELITTYGRYAVWKDAPGCEFLVVNSDNGELLSYSENLKHAMSEAARLFEDAYNSEVVSRLSLSRKSLHDLRQLRLQHWIEVQNARKLQKRVQGVMLRPRQEYYECEALVAFHLSAIQVLNMFFDIGDTAERDYEAMKRDE